MNKADFIAFLKDFCQKNKKQILASSYIIIGLVLLYFLVVKIVFGYSPIKLINDGFYAYNKFIMLQSIKTLQILNLEAHFQNNQFFLGDESILSLKRIALTFKIAVFSLIVIILITPISKRKKLTASTCILVLHFLTYYLKYLILGLIVYKTSLINYNADKLTDSIVHFLFFGFIYLWVWFHRNKLLNFLERKNLNIQLIASKFVTLGIIMLLLIIINDILIATLSFIPYIQFIFNVCIKILQPLGYEAYIDHDYLIGSVGYIQMAKFCLGLNTIYIFIAIVWLTGINITKRLVFSIIGVILINLVNVIRFVMLFIHIQKNEGYKRVMDLHDIYDITIYAFIFIMWIIWFEKYSDIWTHIATSHPAKESKNQSQS